MPTILPAPAELRQPPQPMAWAQQAVVSIVDDEQGFAALQADWNRLADQAPNSSVFLQHEWFDAAWQWRRADSRLAIVVVRLGGQVIGIAPFVCRTHWHHGVRVRALELLTVPDTQWCDVLADAPYERQVSTAVTDTLLGSRLCWDLARLNCLRQDSFFNTRCAPALERAGLTITSQQTGINPTVDLKECWSAYYLRRSRKLKKNNNLVANRLGKAGGADLWWLKGDTSAEQLEKVLTQIVQLSAASWKRSTGLTLNEQGPGCFVRRLTERASARGWLSVWILSIGQQPVAMEYQLQFKGSVYALRADFDDRFKDLSPGSHLNWKMLEQLFDSGASQYCMGHGNNAYKRHWAEGGDAICAAMAYNRSLPGWAARAMDCRVRPALRDWAQRLLKLTG